MEQREMSAFGSRKRARFNPDRYAAVATTLLATAEAADGAVVELSGLAEGCIGVMPVFASRADARAYLERLGSTAGIMLVEATNE
jgi:hypothetical protein